MAEPISFTSETPRWSLPLLFAGQAQKEFFVNEAQTLVDALLHLSIADIAATPPSDPAPGQCWIVDDDPQGEWAGRTNQIAVWASGNWKFVTPQTGMSAFHETLGKSLHFDNSWQSTQVPASPQGGATIDAEARAAIDSLVETLRNLGIFERI